MKTALNIEHGLFEKLETNPPLWWSNLIGDPEVYIDIRKDNYINVYYNGGAIMKLEGEKKYNARIHFEYIPLQTEKDYISFKFKDNEISLEELKTMPLNNFEQEALKKIKKRISNFYPNDSEKGIQGRYVVTNNNKKNSNGFFIDTEFQYNKKRIDMVWVDLKKKKIAFVELKTIGDKRLYPDKNETQETIEKQLTKYYTFVKHNSKDVIKYYNTIYQIKKNLGILPRFVKEESLLEYNIIEKPILLVGDCTKNWIEKHKDAVHETLKDIAFGCVYQGKITFTFNIPYKTSRYRYRLGGI